MTLTKKHPGLIADIGGTNARFALVSEQRYYAFKTFKTNDYQQLEQALFAYLETVSTTPTKALFAIAAPPEGDTIQLTNNHWVIHRARLESQLQCPLHLINDFTAQAYACLDRHLDCTVLQQGSANSNGVQLVLGPGTGLGAAYLIGDQVFATEAGHLTLASRTPAEFEIYQKLSSRYGHVSMERVCSGPGLEAIHYCLTNIQDTAESIFKQVHDSGKSMARNSVHTFINYFGLIASQLAMAINAQRVYLTGGLTQHLMDANLLPGSDFLKHFNNKGRMTPLMNKITVLAINEKEPAMHGMAKAINTV